MQKSQRTYGHILTLIPDIHFGTTINSFLLDIGFTVTHVDSMPQTKKAFEETGADLVISDLVLDTDDALSFLSDFSNTYPDVPIITLTNPNQKQMLNSLRLGAWDCIEKPILDLTQLEHSVCKAFERARLINENKIYRYKLEETNCQLESSLHELEQDQLAGKKVQEQMFPKSDMTIADYHFSHFILPSLYLSGDILDYFKISDRYAGFYIADVSGHGASSAFVTVMVKALFDQLLLGFKQQQSQTILYPEKVFAIANEYLLQASLGKYATMIYGVLDTEKNQLCYGVAGHYPSPLIVSNEGSKFMTTRSFALGMVKKATYKQETIEFPNAGKIALFSDGLLEVIPCELLDDKEEVILNSINTESSISDLVSHYNLTQNIQTPDDITILLVGHNHEKH